MTARPIPDGRAASRLHAWRSLRWTVQGGYAELAFDISRNLLPHRREPSREHRPHLLCRKDF